MKIKVNGEEKFLNSEMCLKDLIQIELNSGEPKGVAVAVNEFIVPMQKWGDTMVKENDSVEIVHAVQGG